MAAAYDEQTVKGEFVKLRYKMLKLKFTLYLNKYRLIKTSIA